MSRDELWKEWVSFTGKYSANAELQNKIFNELLADYKQDSRHYHNLDHIERFFEDVRQYYGGNIPEDLYFAIWFHDAIYNPLKSNNEAKSAELAINSLRELGVPQDLINRIESLILKTADHMGAEVTDEATQVFLDSDLKTLGIPKEEFLDYGQKIRKEYSFVPDFMYKSGRRKFISRMLNAPRIYRTEKFFNLYEKQARKNLETELELMS